MTAGKSDDRSKQKFGGTVPAMRQTAGTVRGLSPRVGALRAPPELRTPSPRGRGRGRSPLLMTAGRAKKNGTTPCVYTKGGDCSQHGVGAGRLRWKPLVNGVYGKDGRTVDREYFYTCDLDPESGKKLSQKKISFLKTTPLKTAGTEKTTEGGGTDSNVSNFSTSKEGQNVGVEQTGSDVRGERFCEDRKF